MIFWVYMVLGDYSGFTNISIKKMSRKLHNLRYIERDLSHKQANSIQWLLKYQKAQTKNKNKTIRVSSTNKTRFWLWKSL